MESLAQTIEVVVLGQLRHEFDELVLKDEDGAFGGEDHITSRLPQNSKAEGRVVRPDELKINILGSLVGNSLLRLVDLISRQDVPAGVFSGDVSGCDLDSQTMSRLVGDGEIEDINVSAVDIAGLSSEVQSGCKAVLVVLNVRGLVTRANALGDLGLGVFDVGKQLCAHINRGRKSVLSGETGPAGQCLCAARGKMFGNLRGKGSIDKD